MFQQPAIEGGTKIIISACATPIVLQSVKLANDPNKA